MSSCHYALLATRRVVTSKRSDNAKMSCIILIAPGNSLITSRTFKNETVPDICCKLQHHRIKDIEISFDLIVSVSIAVLSSLTVVGTHILGGSVQKSGIDGFFRKLDWIIRYYHPINLSWRYYSIIMYRFMIDSWETKQKAISNWEPLPNDQPRPFLSLDNIDIQIKEVSGGGIFSSQGLLSFAAFYQALRAIYWIINSTSTLSEITRPLALMGLLRIGASPWIVSRVFAKIEDETFQITNSTINYNWKNRTVKITWVIILLANFGLSIFMLISPEGDDLIDSPNVWMVISMRYFYLLLATSIAVTHSITLYLRPNEFAHRIPWFSTLYYGILAWITLILFIVMYVVSTIEYSWIYWYSSLGCFGSLDTSVNIYYPKIIQNI